jgi:acetolactate decarboxylase
MKKTVSIIILSVSAALLILSGCAMPASDRETVFQGATMESLLAGNYDSVAAVRDIRMQGDTGLGTFTGLDGEMIVLGGKVYKVLKSGEAELQPDEAGSPFYAVTTFDEDFRKPVGEQTDYEGLKKTMDSIRPRNDLPYAIRIPCTLSSVRVRSEGPFEKPYPVLSEALKQQSEFTYTDIKGTLVGFWFPDFLGNANAAGYHLHFISDDFKKGGHVLEMTIAKGEIQMDETPGLSIAFAPYNTLPLEQETSYR